MLKRSFQKRSLTFAFRCAFFLVLLLCSFLSVLFLLFMTTTSEVSIWDDEANPFNWLFFFHRLVLHVGATLPNGNDGQEQGCLCTRELCVRCFVNGRGFVFTSIVPCFFCHFYEEWKLSFMYAVGILFRYFPFLTLQDIFALFWKSFGLLFLQSREQVPTFARIHTPVQNICNAATLV